MSTSLSTYGSLQTGSPAPSLPCVEAETIDFCYLAGDGAAMRRVRSQLERIAPYMRMALITGEAGTGKEPVARVLHARGSGRAGSFLMWEATQFAERLMEADQGVPLLAEAQGGTLFLAKIYALPLAHQAVLLRILQQQETRTQRGDLRIVASSERDLRTLVSTGQFREELYRRIAAVEIGLTPLRRRREDIAEVAELLLHRAGGRGLSAEAVARLEQHAWPENIRELREVMERAVGLAGAEVVVDVRHLLLPKHQEEEPPPARLQDVVRRHVLDVLTQCSGNKLKASEVLGISRSTLYRMLDACAQGGDPGYPV